MEIIKGESYSIPVVVKSDGQIVTDNMVQGIRIALGSQVATFPDGNLEYNAEEEAWMFPLTQRNAYTMSGSEVDYQVQVKINNEIFSSRIRKVKVYDTMFRKEW